jgi:catechol 2,3-dioxygenase-like lactoylglutathione lyase family enzyme
MSQLAGLAYLGVESAKVDEWANFATNVLGCDVERTETGLNLRVDERESRIAILESDREALSYMGWEATDELAFTSIRREFDKRAISYRLGTAEERAARYCLGLLLTQDPAGNNVEIAYGLRQRHDFVSPRGARFVTGRLGLGHVVLVAPNYDETHDFYTSVLGFRLSDYFQPLPDLPMEFLHCTARHHSVALADGGSSRPGEPDPVGVFTFGETLDARAEGRAARGFLHFMLELEELDMVGRALDRAQAAGCEITQSFGRHSNDKMLSFYMRTPSGFELEYGFGGLLIDENTWSTDLLGRPSIWGHKLAGRGPEI